LIIGIIYTPIRSKQRSKEQLLENFEELERREDESRGRDNRASHPWSWTGKKNTEETGGPGDDTNSRHRKIFHR
jgi:hypothetical protein